MVAVLVSAKENGIKLGKDTVIPLVSTQVALTSQYLFKSYKGRQMLTDVFVKAIDTQEVRPAEVLEFD